VKEIQKALGIQIDGYFGPKTEQAVKDFQTANSLDVDGIVGPRTRAKLAEKEQPAPTEEKKEAAPKPAQPSTPEQAPRKWWLSRGGVGDDVREIQRALGIQADGYYGPKTEQAVKEFQAANSLDADGIVGPRTRAKLAEKSSAAPAPAAPASAMEQLVNMGFSDASANARLLQKYNGDVEQVIAELLGA
jgi:peptidoglycan hydrolase-like protein with peptidoglycan-binding domain